MKRAVIFDVDGTLVDSVALHAKAWQDAFRHFGKDVAFDEVRSQIGKGGDQLMPVFLSKDEIESKGKEIEKYRGDLFKREYLSQVKGFPKVPELFKRLKADGQQVALASSAKGDELTTYKRIAGIEDLVETETSSDDADQSKPEPGYFPGCPRSFGRKRQGRYLWASAIRLTTPKPPEKLGCVLSDSFVEGSQRARSETPAARKSTAMRPTY